MTSTWAPVLRLQRTLSGKAKDPDWDPDEHPRDRIGRFARADSSPPTEQAPTVPPLTDEQYSAHVARLEERLNKAFKRGKATNRTFTHAGNGYAWHPDRARLHKEIVDELWDKYSGVPSEGKAVISGGLGGAGKTTVLAEHAGLDMADFATLNADDVKEIMARRDMIPRAEGVAPLESASLVHEESRHITLMLAERLYAARKNVIWDTTMNGASYVEDLLRDLRNAGYGQVQAVFVDIPVETSVRRALARHRAGLEAWRNGRGYGGRFVPPHIIRKSESWNYPGSSHNRTVFERTKKHFDSWELWDNSVDGQAPKRLGSSAKGAA